MRPGGDAGPFGHFSDTPLHWRRQRLGCPGLHTALPHRYTPAGSLTGSALWSPRLLIVVTGPFESEPSGFPVPPVHEAAAPRRLATMAKSKAAWRPDLNGPAIRDGKKLRPVRAACWAWGSWAKACAPTRC